jgi:hypothetical protein
MALFSSQDRKLNLFFFMVNVAPATNKMHMQQSSWETGFLKMLLFFFFKIFFIFL